MAILIDGYNLLHVSGVFGAGRGRGVLEHAREALLRFLAASLAPEERRRTTVVFDAQSAPYNMPRELEHDEIAVRFAPRESDADTVIEELIAADSAPRQLIVVSSDHRIQRAAQRRRATAVDSDTWWAELVRRRGARGKPAPGPAKPQGPLSPAEVARWLEEFGVASVEPEGADKTACEAPLPESSGEQSPPALDNPFPPGYGEDLTEENVDDRR